MAAVAPAGVFSETWRRRASIETCAQQRTYLRHRLDGRHRRRRGVVVVETTPGVVERRVAVGAAQRKRERASLRAAQARSAVRRASLDDHSAQSMHNSTSTSAPRQQEGWPLWASAAHHVAAAHRTGAGASEHEAGGPCAALAFAYLPLARAAAPHILVGNSCPRYSGPCEAGRTLRC